MTREEVVAHVHELLAATLYQHTYLFYSRHLDTLLLACLYGFCKVNKLQQVRARMCACVGTWAKYGKQQTRRTYHGRDRHVVCVDTCGVVLPGRCLVACCPARTLVAVAFGC